VLLVAISVAPDLPKRQRYASKDCKAISTQEEQEGQLEQAGADNGVFGSRRLEAGIS